MSAERPRKEPATEATLDEAREQPENADPADDAGQGAVEVHPRAPEELRARVEELEEGIEHLQDQLLRRQAELVNYRRRVERERAEADLLSRAAVLRELLPVVDDLERAVHSDAEDLDTYRQGIELIFRRVDAVLAGLGVVRIEPRGEEFDPEIHEAVARHESDEVPEGRVVEVYQPGYRIQERLIRPARVVVATAPRGAPTGGAGESD